MKLAIYRQNSVSLFTSTETAMLSRYRIEIEEIKRGFRKKTEEKKQKKVFEDRKEFEEN